MSSKREEERNEKIIRGLIKLPPNRQCINCNSLGPQYVCTNFWTFICTTCSGIHREFTHRVKSVSMAKFTFQEVDALQKGGNQRARELYLKAWDYQRSRLPDNSNIDKLRDFIKNVYVDKKYSIEKSSDGPPRDPQSLGSHEDKIRRASSYHSYSQSPPYDFQYEERRYGKPAHALTRNHGSDRGLYGGKLAGFLSSARLSDYTNNGSFSNEGSYPRISDFSGPGGSDLFRSDVLSPTYQRDTGSPFSETSRDTSLYKSDTNISKFHPQRTSSSGSFGSFDSSSMSFKSVHSPSFPEVGSEIGPSADVPSLPQSSGSRSFDGLDLFSAPFAPKNVTSTSPTCSSSLLPESMLTQSANIILQSPTSSIPLFSEQQASQILQPSPLDSFISLPQEQSAASNNKKASDVIPNGGWATFDMPQNIVPIGTEHSAPAVVPSDDSVQGTFNPFSIGRGAYQDSAGHGPSISTFGFGPEHLKTVEATINGTNVSTTLFELAVDNFWNAFDAADEGHPTPNVLKINEQAALQSASDAEKSLGDGRNEYSSNYGSATTSNENEPQPFSSSSHFNTTMNDFPMGSAVVGVHSFETDNKPTNPFDLPCDSNMESANMPDFWDMSSLQVALPNLQMPASYVGEIDQSWFPQNLVPSFIIGGVPFDSPSGSLGFMPGQAPNTSISSIHAEAPVASVGGNPFA